MAEIRVNATGELKLFDSDDSNYVSFKSAGTVSSNVAWTLPSADGSSGQMLSTNGSGTLSWATASSADPTSADGDTLGTASAEWSDLYLADSSVIYFGNDQDTTLTHTDGTGLTLNSTNKICFNDASQFIQGSSNAILALGATDEIDLTATAVDLNGTLDVSGNSQFSGTITVGVDDTGKDVKFFGATASSHMLWDESADDLNLIASGLGVITAKDLGIGIHIREADSSASAADNADALVIENSASAGMSILSGTSSVGNIFFGDSGDDDIGKIQYDHADDSIKFIANAVQKAWFRGNATKDFVIGMDSFSETAEGTLIANNQNYHICDSTALVLNRQASDGYILQFRQANTMEGNVTSSGSTIQYNTFCGSHWGRLADNSQPTILRGTVMETIDTMIDWYRVKYTVDEGLETEKIGYDEIALPDGKSVGDIIKHTAKSGIEYDAEIELQDNEQLPMTKVSDTEDSKAVYGVFMSWDNEPDDGINDMNVASLGAFVIRVHKDETVAIGDLLSSKGDGTAKVQADDIMRSKTIAKVTSTNKSHIHADDSYCVPCTLHCG